MCHNMDTRYCEAFKMSPLRKGRRKQTGVLPGIIVWNALLLMLLVLTVCVQGEGEAGPSDLSPRQDAQHAAKTVKKGGAGNPEESNSDDKQKPSLKTVENDGSEQSKDSQVEPKSSEEVSEEERDEERSKEEGAAAKPGKSHRIPESNGSKTNGTTKDDTESGGLFPSHISSVSTDALLRGFYVFVGVGAIILIYIVIKMARLRKRRAAGKYRILSHSDDQEMFPLAAGEGEDEEIFNAAHHQSRK